MPLAYGDIQGDAVGTLGEVEYFRHFADIVLEYLTQFAAQTHYSFGSAEMLMDG
jgi:hypothetical protein